VGSFLVRALFDEFHAHSIFVSFFNKGEIQTINHQNVLQVWETVNISVLSI
jgi:hypothetical protein